MTRWWWIRHAPVQGSTGIIAPADAPADLGNQPALAALRAQLPVQALWLTSPFARALQTCEALTQAAVQTIPAFAEQDFGRWTGQSHAALARQSADDYHAFWLDPASNAPPEGESFIQQMARVADAVAALNQKYPEHDLIAIAHAGTIRAALAQALDLAPMAALRFALPTLSLTRMDWIAPGWRILMVGKPVPDSARHQPCEQHTLAKSPARGE